MVNPLLTPDYGMTFDFHLYIETDLLMTLVIVILDETINQFSGPNRVVVPFVACGDLSGWDADKTYALDVCCLHFILADFYPANICLFVV